MMLLLTMLIGAASAAPCPVKVSEEGNRTYAWYYLKNTSDADVAVTIERSWTYERKRRTETARMSLYPGQHKNVMSMNRKQAPKVEITRCEVIEKTQ